MKMSLSEHNLKVIDERLKEYNMSRNILAESIGMTGSGFGKWFKGADPKKSLWDKALIALNLIEVDGMLIKQESYKNGSFSIPSDTKDIRYAPVLDYVQAGHFTSLSNIDTSELEQIILPPNVDFDPDKDFIVKVNGDSMLNKSHKKCLYPDEYLVVDTKKNYHIGDIVVAYIEGNNEATVKLLTGEVGNMYLEPLNEKYLGRDGFVIPKGSQVTIKGVVKAVIPPARQFIS